MVVPVENLRQEKVGELAASESGMDTTDVARSSTQTEKRT
jgi:hypothetical protein